ncbi:MAG: signal peptidase I [Dehalococcoidales bacterium]|nr:signal peptidase I [Dehalococcoidales bacterium]
MKNLVLIIVFIGLILLSVFGIPALLEITLDVEQPILTVTSYSMWPELSRGDIVFVKKTGIEDIEIGSVIVFRHGNGLAVHRVIEIRGTTIITKGDANPTADNPISFDDVVGRVPNMGNTMVKIPWVGHFSLFKESEEVDTVPDTAIEPGFWQQLSLLLLNPVSITVLTVTIVAILFQNRISNAMSRVRSMSVRKRRLKARTRRLPQRSR